MNIIFLHHSTGEIIWNGGPNSLIKKVVGRLSDGLAEKMNKKCPLPSLFENYNILKEKNYRIDEMTFPKATP